MNDVMMEPLGEFKAAAPIEGRPMRRSSSSINSSSQLNFILNSNGADEEDNVFVADQSTQGLLSSTEMDFVEGGSLFGGAGGGEFLIAEEDPSDQPPTGYFRTMVNFLKGNLGTGVLAVPDAIKNAGLIFGTISLALIGALSTYCCHQLLKAYRQISNDRALTYAQVIDIIFKKASPPFLRRLATPAQYLIDTVLISTQLGFCTVYVLFCSRMFKEVIDDYQAPEHRHSIQFYETLLTAFLVPYCFVTTMKSMAIFATLANFITVFVLGMVMQYSIRNVNPISSVPWFPHSFNTVPLFFGTAMFSFESIALLLPIENAMKERHRFHGWNGLLSLSMALVIALYVFVGIFGYLAFGKDAQMILSNMPAEDSLYQFIKLLYCFCIVVSYNLQMYVPVQITMPFLKRSFNRDWFNLYGEYIVRTLMVLTTYFFALNIPCLEKVISLFGAFASSWLALILPPVVEVVSCYHQGQHHRLTPWLFIKNGFIVAFGLCGCILGTAVAVKSIVDALKQPGGCSAN